MVKNKRLEYKKRMKVNWFEAIAPQRTKRNSQTTDQKQIINQVGFQKPSKSIKLFLD